MMTSMKVVKMDLQVAIDDLADETLDKNEKFTAQFDELPIVPMDMNLLTTFLQMLFLKDLLMLNVETMVMVELLLLLLAVEMMDFNVDKMKSKLLLDLLVLVMVP